MKREVLFLDAAVWHTTELCNYALFDVYGSGEDSNIHFHDEVHQRVFFIMLVDFLSPSDREAIGEAIPYLSALAAICESPFFDKNDSIRSLKQTVASFRAWLNEKAEIYLWLSGIEVEETIQLSRLAMIKAAGNIVKHSHTRLWGVAKHIDKLLRAKGHDYSKGTLLLDLHEGLYFRLYEDIGNYHGSTLAEFLNEIRWGIHDYLTPEFRRSYRKTGESEYTFDVPAELNEDEFTRSLYWRIMNSVRSGPIVPRFRVTKYLKIRH